MKLSKLCQKLFGWFGTCTEEQTTIKEVVEKGVMDKPEKDPLHNVSPAVINFVENFNWRYFREVDGKSFRSLQIDCEDVWKKSLTYVDRRTGMKFKFIAFGDWRSHNVDMDYQIHLTREEVRYIHQHIDYSKIIVNDKAQGRLDELRAIRKRRVFEKVYGGEL